MIWKTLTAVVLALAWTCAAAADTTQAAKTWQARCVTCHQVPDLHFTTDHAWLDQVNRTG